MSLEDITKITDMHAKARAFTEFYYASDPMVSVVWAMNAHYVTVNRNIKDAHPLVYVPKSDITIEQAVCQAIDKYIELVESGFDIPKEF